MRFGFNMIQAYSKMTKSKPERMRKDRTYHSQNWIKMIKWNLYRKPKAICRETHDFLPFFPNQSKLLLNFTMVACETTIFACETTMAVGPSTFKSAPGTRRQPGSILHRQRSRTCEQGRIHGLKTLADSKKSLCPQIYLISDIYIYTFCIVLLILYYTWYIFPNLRLSI